MHFFNAMDVVYTNLTNIAQTAGMKALLFTLIRAYEFELGVPKEDVLVKRAFPVNRPAVKGEGKTKTDELPMIIRPVV